MFGKLVRAHRLRLAISQEDLAELAKVSVRQIRRLENDLVGVPRPATRRLLADALGLAGNDREDFCRSAAHDN